MISPSELWAFIQHSYAEADSQLPGGPPSRVVLPKRYTVTFNAVAAGGTQSQVLQIGANGDFFMARMSFYATPNPVVAETFSTAIIPAWRIQITDSGSDEQFASGPVDLSNFANWTPGSNDQRDEPYPRIITGRSTLNLQVFSYETVATYNVDFVLTGVLVKTFQ